MNWNSLIDEVHSTALEQGWWDPGPSDAGAFALIHSEIAEATECIRNGLHENEENYVEILAPAYSSEQNTMTWEFYDGIGVEDFQDFQEAITWIRKALNDGANTWKPRGIAFEYADVIIRLLDFLGRKNASLCIEELEETLRHRKAIFLKSDGSLDIDLLAVNNALHVELAKFYDEYEIFSDIDNVQEETVEFIGLVHSIFRDMGWNFELIVKLKCEYNKQRAYKHGGKAS